MPDVQPKQTNWALIVLVAFGIFYFAERWKKSSPDPDPNPKPAIVNVQKVVSSTLQKQREGFSEAFSKAAIEVREGRIETGEKLFSILQSSLKAGFAASSDEFDSLLQENLPRGEGDKLGSGADRFLDSIASAFKRAK